MYLSQTYGSESKLCAGTCRGIEAGAEGTVYKQPKGSESEFRENKRVNIG